MTYLKQHRKGTLEVEGRKLTGNFEVSLTNQGDREMITEFISEIRKQLLKFNPTKKKRKKIKRRK
jgi:nitrogenase subunit NifH